MNFRLTGPRIKPLEGDWPTEAFARRRKNRNARAAGEPTTKTSARAVGAGSGERASAAPPSSPASPRPHAPKHRTDDPQTSRDAAARALPRAGTCKRRLIDAIAKAPNGLTYDEAGRRAQPPVPGVTASTRLTELVRDGLLEKTGDTRPTANGRQADVLVIAAGATAAIGRSAAA